ncbi:conserved hypothetical protein [Neospora caninum Liverpool]|uniref:Uncharacterized protein n=1 Tax=Neospora caninum (strain Liverpool) TaxID=572307 RepID=F0VLD2_NEOCL|nr:conserved hypothetical protein [Neospora caninum Liverpool]CBZ54884.1 conserved hypothetical protein [Neospora caninum Liverpool]|eukprot:XP_003884912.1 conserved hypothetical protein [Neospora caninum Liverpool]
MDVAALDADLLSGRRHCSRLLSAGRRTDRPAQRSRFVSQKPIPRCGTPLRPSSLLSAASPASRLKSRCLAETGSQCQLSGGVDPGVIAQRGPAREGAASENAASNPDGDLHTHARAGLSNTCERGDMEAAAPLATDLLTNFEDQLPESGDGEQESERVAPNSSRASVSSLHGLNRGMRARPRASESLSPPCQRHKGIGSASESLPGACDKEGNRFQAKVRRVTSPHSDHPHGKILRLVPLSRDRARAHGIHPQTLVGCRRVVGSSRNEDTSVFRGRPPFPERRSIPARFTQSPKTGTLITNKRDENSQLHELMNRGSGELGELPPDAFASVNNGKHGKEHSTSGCFHHVLSREHKEGNSLKGTAVAGPRASVDSISSYIDASSDPAGW